MSARDRLTAWRGVLAAVVLLNAASALSLLAPVGPTDLAIAAGLGLGVALFVHLVVYGAWTGVVEYRDAGGRWGDALVAAPFVVGAAAGVGAYAFRSEFGVAVVAAEWGFLLSVGALAFVVQLLVGYRESESSQPIR